MVSMELMLAKLFTLRVGGVIVAIGIVIIVMSLELASLCEIWALLLIARPSPLEQKSQPLLLMALLSPLA